MLTVWLAVVFRFEPLYANVTANVQRYLRMFAIVENPIKIGISHNNGRFWWNQRFDSAYLHHVIPFPVFARSPVSRFRPLFEEPVLDSFGICSVSLSDFWKALHHGKRPRHY
ncbi:MAG: hypothetical protein ACI9R3_004472 [Verrucomicrobiales bacterium]|jgi:hypothetical protein